MNKKFEIMWEGIRKKTGAKKQKKQKNFLEWLSWLSGKGLFPECQHRSTRGSQYFPRVSGFSTRERAPSPSVFFALGEEFFYFKPQRRRLFGTSRNTFLPRERLFPGVALGEDEFFWVLFFPECQVGYGSRGSLSSPSAILPREQHSGKTGFPSARFLVLGKAFDTREISILP